MVARLEAQQHSNAGLEVLQELRGLGVVLLARWQRRQRAARGRRQVPQREARRLLAQRLLVAQRRPGGAVGCKG